MSLYKNYVEERTDKKIIETDQGFIVYQFGIKEHTRYCYIEDIYILPAFRKQAIGTQLEDEVITVAIKQNCTKLYGSVCLSVKNVTASMQILLARGYKYSHQENDILFYKKEI